ncbi:MAG: hypothetical protein ABF760_04240 [Zymomonas mobilis]
MLYLYIQKIKQALSAAGEGFASFTIIFQRERNPINFTMAVFSSHRIKKATIPFQAIIKNKMLV